MKNTEKLAIERPTFIPPEIWRLLPPVPLIEYPKFPCAILPLPRFVLDQICPEIQPPPGTDIRLENLAIQPTEVKVSEKVTITVIATNYGTAQGAKTVICKVNGTSSQQTVTLGPGESNTITFEAVPTEAKTYQVQVNGLSGNFTATPITVSIYLRIINYPAGSATWQASLAGGGNTDERSMSDMPLLVGPSVTSLTVEILNEFGQIFYRETIPVTLEDGQMYWFDCEAKTLIKQVIRFGIISLNIPSPITDGDEFNPSVALKIPNEDMSYNFGLYIRPRGVIYFSDAHFLPPQYMSQIVDPERYIPLDSPDDTYSISGCEISRGWSTPRGACRLMDPTTQQPPPLGIYPVYAVFSWAGIRIEEGAVVNNPPQGWIKYENVATIEVV